MFMWVGKNGGEGERSFWRFCSLFLSLLSRYFFERVLLVTANGFYGDVSIRGGGGGGGGLSRALLLKL